MDSQEIRLSGSFDGKLARKNDDKERTVGQLQLAAGILVFGKEVRPFRPIPCSKRLHMDYAPAKSMIVAKVEHGGVGRTWSESQQLVHGCDGGRSETMIPRLAKAPAIRS